MQGAEFSSGELLQSEGNRITQNAMAANHRSLMLLADKLYRRNPAEWRKSAATRETALALSPEVPNVISPESCPPSSITILP